MGGELPVWIDHIIELIRSGKLERGDGTCLEPVDPIVPIDGPFEIDGIAQSRFCLQCIAHKVCELGLVHRCRLARHYPLEHSALAGEDEVIRRAIACH
jgi:hypothetical protein